MGLESLGTGGLTLPDNYDMPTKPPQGPPLIAVPGDVLRELLLPELDATLRRISIFAPRVPVPETAMDEYHRSVLRQNDIGTAGQISSVKPKPVPKLV